MAIGITEDGKHQGYIGTALKGNGVLEFSYESSPETGNFGHWGLTDIRIPITKSGENTCLPDAALEARSEKKRQELGIHASEDLLIKMVEYSLADPEHALKSDLHYQRLTDLDPALGMQGAGVWVEAAKTMDDLVAQYPSQLITHLIGPGKQCGHYSW